MNANNISINRSLLRWVLFGLGIIGLVVMAVALIATPGNRFETVSIIALIVGIVGLAGFVLLDPQELITAITGRTGLYGITTAAISLFFIGVMVGLFLIIREADITPKDVTEAGKYQLSNDSIELLENMEGEVHAVGFYTAQQSFQQEEAEIWLQQYAKLSNGKITYEFIDPDRDPGEAQRMGLTSAGVIIFEQDDRTAEASTTNERGLTTALVRVLLGEERIAYAITGHGEREITDFTDSGFSDASDALARANFAVNELNLLAEGSVPDDADLIIVAGPLAQFSAPEVEAISTYLDSGGAGLFLFDPGTGGGQLGNGVLGISYSEDGDIIATAGADGTAKLWDASSGDELVTLRGHASDVLDVSISPNGDVVATAGRDGTVRIWDIDSGEPIRQLEGQTDLVRRIEFSRDGDYLISVGEDQVVNIWDTSTFEPTPYSPIATTTPLFAMAVSPDGQLVAAAGARNTATGAIQGELVVWDVTTGQEAARADLHSDVVLGLAFTPDNDTLVSVARDGTEGRLDIASGDASTVSLYPDLGITAIGIADDGTRAYALGDGSIHVRANEDASIDDDLILTGHTAQVWALKMSPDGDHFLTASRDGTARAWSLSRESNTLRLTAHTGSDQLVAYLADEWGIVVNDDIVIDVVTASAFDALTPVMYSPESYNTLSPITQPLIDKGPAQTFFIRARSLTVDEEATSRTLTPLLFTSGQQPGDSWAETNPSAPNIEFDAEDIPGPITLGVSGEDMDSEARVVVIGDADFASNNGLGFATYGNGDLLINSANWLTEGETLDLPSPNIGQNVLDNPLSQAGLIIVTLASVCIIPALVLVTGAVIWFVRRRRR